MGLLDRFKKKKGGAADKAISPAFLNMLSRYMGPSLQRQLTFGELVVQNRNWNLDFGRAVIAYGTDEYPIQLLGSESLSSGTWLWGFANPSGFSDEVLNGSRYAHTFCGAAPELAPETLVLTELVNGHSIASISLGAQSERQCYYRCPYDGGAAFVLVGNIPGAVFAPVDAIRVTGLISDLIAAFSLEHKTLVKSLLDINCDCIDESADKLSGRFAGGTSLSVSFEAETGRIASMNTR